MTAARVVARRTKDLEVPSSNLGGRSFSLSIFHSYVLDRSLEEVQHYYLNALLGTKEAQYKVQNGILKTQILTEQFHFAQIPNPNLEIFVIGMGGIF